MSRVFAVVPAHNEAMTILQTVHALEQVVDVVVVVADSCRDNTAQLAREAGVHVIERRGRGDKAQALAEGLRWVGQQSPQGTDIVVFVDGDVGSSAREIRHLVEAIRGLETGMVVGVLPPAGRRGGFGLVVRLARAMVYGRTGKQLRAPLSGQRALHWAALQRLKGLAKGFGVEVGLAIDLISAGVEVKELEVAMTHRHMGRGWRGFYHRARQGWHVLLAGIGFRQVILWKHGSR